jgi:hypothetical protein
MNRLPKHTGESDEIVADGNNQAGRSTDGRNDARSQAVHARDERERQSRSCHTFAESFDGLAVINVDTFEELNDLMLQTPAAAITDLKVYPLTDFDRQMDRTIKMLEMQKR